MRAANGSASSTPFRCLVVIGLAALLTACGGGGGGGSGGSSGAQYRHRRDRPHQRQSHRCRNHRRGTRLPRLQCQRAMRCRRTAVPLRRGRRLPAHSPQERGRPFGCRNRRGERARFRSGGRRGRRVLSDVVAVEPVQHDHYALRDARAPAGGNELSAGRGRDQEHAGPAPEIRHQYQYRRGVRVADPGGGEGSGHRAQGEGQRTGHVGAGRSRPARRGLPAGTDRPARAADQHQECRSDRLEGSLRRCDLCADQSDDPGSDRRRSTERFAGAGTRPGASPRTPTRSSSTTTRASPRFPTSSA